MNTYCPLPWRHVYIDGDGVKPCCSYTKRYKGYVNEWLTSDELQSMQQQILNGEIPIGCQSCIAGEKKSGYSTRKGALNDYGDMVITDTKIDYVDYRSVNICNFKCRSCEPLFSNGIYQDTKKHPDLAEFYSLIPNSKLSPTTITDKEWILQNLHQIKRLMFTGGEPTKIPAVREIIEQIVKLNLDINLMITSNCSFTDPFWFELTKSHNVHWTCSLDAVEDAAEIIRHGTVWPLVKNNIETLFDLASSVNIGTVVTNISLFQLKSLFNFANKLENRFEHRANGRTQFIEICKWPDFMSPYNWPPDLVPKVIDYLNSINLDGLQPRQRSVIENLLQEIPINEFDSSLWERSERYNAKLDKIRKQDHSSLFNGAKYPAKEDIIHASK